MTPKENFDFLNSYLKRVSPIIRKNNGFINKYMGDGIMALFPNRAEDAVIAGIEKMKELSFYNSHRQKSGYAPINIGIGLHTGTLILGTIGEEERMQGDIISDSVNTVSRMEGLTKLYGASIIISEQTLNRLEDASKYNHRFLGKVQVKGKKEPISVFEIFDGDSENIIETKIKTKTDFENALKMYYEKKFAEASVEFNNILKNNAQDKTARLYLERSAHFMVNGTSPDWEGVEVLENKF
jgi:two-component system sensor histidine kinase ChiS